MRLQFLGEERELARRILVALVRSYGLKSQKTLADLAVEIGETEENIRTVLNQLVQLRMVRPIDGHYEIVHDFLAKRISEELMEVYEREVKQFRELLASKLGAFTRTGELLTKREHLYLYFYRKQFACTQPETKYLFLSHLAGNGPVQYWIKDWSRETLEEYLEEAFQASDEVMQRNAYRYAINIGKPPTLEIAAKLFGDYRHRNEFARYIPLLANETDIPLLLKLRRKKAKEVKDVVDSTIIKLISPRHQHELEMIARSSAKDIDSLLIDVADKFTREKPHSESKDWKTDMSLVAKVLSIIALSSSGNNDDLHNFISAASDKSNPKKLRSILYVATFRLAIRLANYSLIDELIRDPELRTYLYRGIRDSQNQHLLRQLLSFWPHDGDHSLLTQALVHAVRRSTYKQVYPVLKRNLERSGVRELILAIAKFGNALDFEKVLKTLLKSKHQLLIPSPSIAAFAMRELAGRKNLPWLRQLVVLREMRSYYGQDRVRGETLSIGNYLNIYLLRYFIAFAFCYLARDTELPILVDLLESKYWCVSFPAAEALAKLGKETSVNEITQRALAAQDDNRAGFLRGLVAVDRVVYPGISKMDGWELMYETAG